jgi:hypothetical protein
VCEKEPGLGPIHAAAAALAVLQYLEQYVTVMSAAAALAVLQRKRAVL